MFVDDIITMNKENVIIGRTNVRSNIVCDFDFRGCKKYIYNLILLKGNETVFNGKIHTMMDKI